MEIIDIKVFLPAQVKIKTSDGTSDIHIFFNQATGEVIVRDVVPVPIDFHEKVLNFLKAKRIHVQVPVAPKEGFQKLNPDEFSNL